MKTQELDLFTKIKNRFSEQEAQSFIEYLEKTITEKTEEAVKQKTTTFIDRKEMSEFVIEMKIAINNLNNSITNLENKLDNKITNLENKLDNSITNVDNKITNLESRLDLKIEKASNKNLWLVITVGIIQITTVLIAIYLNNHH